MRPAVGGPSASPGAMFSGRGFFLRLNPETVILLTFAALFLSSDRNGLHQGSMMKLLASICRFLAQGFSSLLCAGIIVPSYEAETRKTRIHYYIEAANYLKDGFETAKKETASDRSSGRTKRA